MVLTVARRPGGFRKLWEACRIHLHLSWHLSDFVVQSDSKRASCEEIFSCTTCYYMLAEHLRFSYAFLQFPTARLETRRVGGSVWDALESLLGKVVECFFADVSDMFGSCCFALRLLEGN